ncbi:MAG: hypothetical protein K0R38_4512 [Polyangiaceae bacterium]|jgi:hypothetical protein|nr:hypothetical protein [Polyangiaceae bacterium]
MTAKSERAFLDKQRNASANVLDSDHLKFLAKERAEVEQLVRQAPSVTVGRKFPAAAAALREQLAAEGEVELLAGDLRGWTKIRDAQAFVYWEARVYEAAFDRDERPDRWRRGLSVVSFADCLIALHLGAADAASALMKRLVGESQGTANNYWQASTGAITFMARMYEQRTNQKLDMAWSKLPPLGGYEKLLADDCTGDAYVSALEWGCTEHIAQTRETKQKLLPFVVGLSTAMPIELMTWLQQRRAQGLDFATHGHPLLESPLANLDPPVSQAPSSDLLQLLELGIPHMQAYLADQRTNP